MNLLSMMAGGNFRKTFLNPAIVMWREIAQRKLAITQNIHTRQPWNP
jgi:hypothetical protein